MRLVDKSSEIFSAFGLSSEDVQAIAAYIKQPDIQSQLEAVRDGLMNPDGIFGSVVRYVARERSEQPDKCFKECVGEFIAGARRYADPVIGMRHMQTCVNIANLNSRNLLPYTRSRITLQDIMGSRRAGEVKHEEKQPINGLDPQK